MSVSIDENRVSYSLTAIDAGDITYVNTIKDLSWLNSRNFEHSTRDGHLYGCLCDITIIDNLANQYSFLGPANTWRLRNGFRKWHFAREHMFREAGVTNEEKGRYGRTIRPFMLSDSDTTKSQVQFEALPGGGFSHKEINTLSPVGADDDYREWSYTEVAAHPGFTDLVAAEDLSLPLADTFVLALNGLNLVEATDAGVSTWKSVGIIHSYNQDRMDVVTPTEGGGETVEGPNNPLASMFFTGTASGEVMEIAEDQEAEKPPYDIRDAGDSTKSIIYDYTVTNTDAYQVTRIRNVFVPGGIFAFSPTDDPTGLMTVHVKAIVECKDW